MNAPDYLALLGHKAIESLSDKEAVRRATLCVPRRSRGLVHGKLVIRQWLRDHGAHPALDIATATGLTYHTAYKYCRLLVGDGVLYARKERGQVLFGLNVG